MMCLYVYIEFLSNTKKCIWIGQVAKEDGLWCLAPLSTILEYSEKTIDLSQENFIT
jgi:hypothetical protein